MSETIKAFAQYVSEHEDIKEKLKAASSKEEVLALAEECGFKLTDTDGRTTLTEEDLEKVAGGFEYFCIFFLFLGPS